MRRLGLFLLPLLSLHAQYFDFAVTDNGQLYFSSTLLTGATKDIALKVYRLSNAGPELFGSGGGGEDVFGVTASGPLVSGDGSITGYALTEPCRSGSCGIAGGPRTVYRLQGTNVGDLAYPYLQISRNGRFLLGVRSDFKLALTELPSQKTVEAAPYFGWVGPQTVANSGAVLMRGPSDPILLYRTPDGESRIVAGSEGATSAALSPTGDLVAYERKRDGRFELVLTDPSGSSEQVLVSGTTELSYGYQPRFANDGTLLYLDADRQPAVLAGGAKPRRLTTVDAGFQRAIPSGDGSIAWLESSVGQLLRIRIIDGSVEEVVPATPFVAGVANVAYPGSVIHFAGTGLAKNTRFRLGDTLLPLSALEKGGAAVQVPWEHLSSQSQEVVTVQGEGNPFYQRTDYFPLSRPSILFERELNSRVLKAAHQDWHGPISEADPAAPGETIHVFARNMGPVDKPVATGQPSPDPPARVITPFACYLFEMDGQSPVRARGLVVPFAGLSSGLIGIYHVDVTIPADWTARDAQLQCVMDNGGNLFAGDSEKFTVGQ